MAVIAHFFTLISIFKRVFKNFFHKVSSLTGWIELKFWIRLEVNQDSPNMIFSFLNQFLQ
jgi:hypothetical protein